MSGDILVSDLTIEHFSSILGILLGSMFLFFVICYVIYRFICFIIDFVFFHIRKDKYKSLDFAVIESYRYISRLRKQVKYAPSEKAYILYYNRLAGAVSFLVHMGYISSKASTRILDVRANFMTSEE